MAQIHKNPKGVGFLSKKTLMQTKNFKVECLVDCFGGEICKRNCIDNKKNFSN
jgi:hypothetical protein